MKVLPKDFLSIEDIASYFKQLGYIYDLEIQSEHRRLVSDIYDLANESKVVAVFHYYGRFQKEIEEFEYDEDSTTGEPVRIPIYQDFSNIIIGDYFCIQKTFLKDVFLSEKEIIVDDYFERYGHSTVTPQGRDISYYSHDSVQISLRDIRIPRYELDNLFKEYSPIQTVAKQTDNPDKILSNERTKVIQPNPIANSRNQDGKIIAMMAILLAERNTKYRWGDKPNKSAIERGIQDLIDNKFYVDHKHTHGLDAPHKRIAECLSEFSEFFYTVSKPKDM